MAGEGIDLERKTTGRWGSCIVETLNPPSIPPGALSWDDVETSGAWGCRRMTGTNPFFSALLRKMSALVVEMTTRIAPTRKRQGVLA